MSESESESVACSAKRTTIFHIRWKCLPYNLIDEYRKTKMREIITCHSEMNAIICVKRSTISITSQSRVEAQTYTLNHL